MMRPLAVINGALGSLLVLCLVLRLAAWLVTPVIPLVIVALCLVGLPSFALFGRTG
jgi:hypothetical protein